MTQDVLIAGKTGSTIKSAEGGLESCQAESASGTDQRCLGACLPMQKRGSLNWPAVFAKLRDGAKHTERPIAILTDHSKGLKENSLALVRDWHQKKLLYHFKALNSTAPAALMELVSSVLSEASATMAECSKFNEQLNFIVFIAMRSSMSVQSNKILTERTTCSASSIGRHSASV